MFCEKCGALAAQGQQVCPRCGAKVLEQAGSKRINPIVHIVLGILIAGMTAALGLMVLPSKAAKEAVQGEEKEQMIAAQTVNSKVDSPYVQQVDMKILSTSAAVPPEEPEAEEEESEYIFEDSDERFLEEGEIYDLTQEEMRIARNEIYARYGRQFSDEALQKYFESRSWYTPVYTGEEFDAMGDDIFNEYEYYNKNLISEIEEELGYR